MTTLGLPIPSGISMVVSDDGKHWYAWRKTPGGHHFAIGASEPPPNQWKYDGPDSPSDLPGIGVEWGEYKDLELLIDYGERLGNGAVFKRLGFLLEKTAPDETKAMEACSERLTTGNTSLDSKLN